VAIFRQLSLYIGDSSLFRFSLERLTLSTANYLYDIRPFRSDFAIYAALQAALSTGFVFVGAMVGVNASYAAAFLIWSGYLIKQPNICGVYGIGHHGIAGGIVVYSALGRAQNSPKAAIADTDFRIRGLNAILGVSLDW
jgi:hypothetical protein